LIGQVFPISSLSIKSLLRRDRVFRHLAQDKHTNSHHLIVRPRQSAEHLYDSDRQRPRLDEPSGIRNPAQSRHLQRSRTLRRATARHLVEPPLIRSRAAPGALRDVQHDAERSPLELIAQDSKPARRQQRAAERVQLEGDPIDLEPLMVNGARLVTRKAWRESNPSEAGNDIARQLPTLERTLNSSAAPRETSTYRPEFPAADGRGVPCSSIPSRSEYSSDLPVAAAELHGGRAIGCLLPGDAVDRVGVELVLLVVALRVVDADRPERSDTAA
jgi:hypothetical protein